MLSESERERLAVAAALIRTIRRGFRRLAGAGDRLHADLGVTAAMRVVLEMLDENGPMTVPQMARAKGLSRQHFQTKVDLLAAHGLVEARTNPAHARSVLIGPTAEGTRVFAAMSAREAAAIAAATKEMDAEALSAATDVVERFTEALDHITTRDLPETKPEAKE